MNGTEIHGARKGDGKGVEPGVGGAARMRLGQHGLSPAGLSPAERSLKDRPLGDLLSELSHGLLSLVRDEMKFAKVEMSEKAERTGRDLAYISVGAAVAFAGFLSLLAALVLGLALYMPLWLSCLSVGSPLGLAGFLLLRSGMKRLRHEEPVPREASETLKEEAEWLKERMT